MLKVTIECGEGMDGTSRIAYSNKSSIAVGDVVSYNGELHYVRTLVVTVDAGKVDISVGVSRPGVTNQITNTFIEPLFKINGEKLVNPHEIAEYDYAKATYAYLVARAKY